MYSEATQRAEEYATRRSLSIEKQLGGGTQGVVLSTSEGTAVKALVRPEFYVRERDVYKRLKKLGIGNVAGFNVPRLLDCHDELLVIEMQIVTTPFVLDFASAYLDSRPSYADEPEIMADWEADKLEQFEGRWPNAHYVEYLTPCAYIEELTATPPRLDAAGLLPIPDAPGLGIEIDREKLERFSTPIENWKP